ncbi:FAD-dependent oxidoreductase, partial [Raoultella sp. 18097]|uniref:FAD-dependent oxidoreductase n=1 Tax=Raoultella sp. 18097 TaxID=2681429 RepID=UPI00190FA648
QMALQRTWGCEQESVSAARCVELEPALAHGTDRIAGAIHTPSECAADCRKVCEGLQALLAARGVRFVLDAQLRGFERRADGRIAAVGEQLQPPEGTQKIDARGMTLMPGLIDCHVHVVASSFNLGTVAKMPNVFTMLRSLPIMRGMLDRGFTTVRDAGGADWSLAEAVRT